MADITSRMDALTLRRREAEQQLQARVKAMQPLLPLIERLSLYPAETLLAVPAPRDQALRGILVLQGLSKQIETETEALSRDQAALDALAEALRVEASRLAAAMAERKRQTDALDKAIDTARAIESEAEENANEAASRAAEAAGRMDTLRAALAVLEQNQRAGEAKAREEEARTRAEEAKVRSGETRTRSEEAKVRSGETRTRSEEADPRSGEAKARAEEAHAAPQKRAAREAPEHETLKALSGFAGTITSGARPSGQLQPPVIGVVVRGWGEQTDGGPAAGLSYHAPPGAHVVSPCGGRVVFAEAFRSYGLLLIVDCGGGYHVVLAGFQRLDVKPGQRLLVGEPVGVMPDWEPRSTAPRPALYVELRHDGTPVNPAPWLRSSS